jgi:sec-independent protein translocase protein TatA
MFVNNLASGDTLIVIVVAAALLFGGSAIPKLARNLGSAKNEFEKGLEASKAKKSAPAAHEATPDADDEQA